MSGDHGLRRELMRWLICGAIVISLHAGVVAAALYWPDDSAPAGAATVMVELAPLAQESAAMQQNLPLGPEQEVQTEPTPEPVKEIEEEKPEPEPLPQKVVELPPEPPPPVPAEVTLPPEPKEEKKEPAKKKMANATAPERAERIAPRQRAATQGAPTPNPNLLSSYGASIIRPHLMRFHDIQGSSQGVVVVRFTISRSGRLMSRGIARSSGHSELDSKALSTLTRAQPFPPPPAGLSDAQFNFTLNMNYNKR